MSKHFSSFFKNPVPNSIFLSPTDALEVSNCISSLNLSKSSGLMVFLLKSCHLSTKKFLFLYQLLYIHVQGFLDKNNVLYSQQYGFRKNYSTTQTLIDISQKIMDALDKGEYACGIFIDLQIAFDSVDHEILFEKLFHYGIRGKALSLFKSYRTGRK